MDAAVVEFHRLQIGQPATFRLVHCVANVVTRHRALATDLTAFRHNLRILPQPPTDSKDSRGSSERPGAVEVLTLDGRGYAKFLAAGAYFLRKYRQVLNDLNVFPVPDGDTGTNMYLTVRSAMVEAAKVHDAVPLSEVAAHAAQGSLMGARGNSGVIISQMLRGFAHHVRHRAEIDTFVIATGLREAAAAARHALVRPVEGTIVSVAEAAAEAAYRLAVKEPDLYRFLRGVLGAANEALEHTPEQLPTLKEAGVVDSGGAGFVYFLEGILSFLPDVKVRATAFPRRPLRARVFSARQVVGEHKYCTEFVLEGATIGAVELRHLLEARGESLIVAGAEPALRVHIHTDDPQRVKELAETYGTLSHVKVDDMEQQHRLLVVEKPQRTYSIVAVVPGEGFARIVRELGVEVVVSTAKTPTVRDMLLAVNKCLSDEVYLFVDDRSASSAAAELPALTLKHVHVIATGNIVAGIAGLFAFRSVSGRVPHDDEILAAAERVRSAQVAATDGLTIGEAVRRTLSTMDADGGLVTLYYGGTQKERDARHLADEMQAAFPDSDVEYYYGGMKNAEYWISVDV